MSELSEMYDALDAELNDENADDWDETLEHLWQRSKEEGIPFDHLVGMHLGGVDY